MKSGTPLDYAVFQLSPKRSRCELLVSSDGNTEKLASVLVKQFVTHLKVAEEQVAQAVKPIKLEVDKDKNAETWFTKGTLERFMRFVSMPEVLELISTLDTEMSQLEAARRIYYQGAGDQQGDSQGWDGAGTTAADATMKELVRAIDVRIAAVGQHLAKACAHASAAGYNPDTVSELQHFADRFGAHRLNKACTKFLSLHQRKPDLTSPWETGGDERDIRSSVGSDMSIDDPTEDQSGPHIRPNDLHVRDQSKSFAPQTFASRRSSNGNEKDDKKNEAKHNVVTEKETKGEVPSESPPLLTPAAPPARRLSVQDRINLFENKQKENSGGSGGINKPIVGKSLELRRLSSDLSTAPAVAAVEKSVLKRWSGASDMSIDVSDEKKDSDSPLCTPSSVSSVSETKSNAFSVASEDKYQTIFSNSESSINAEPPSGQRGNGDVKLKDQTDTQNCFGVSAAKEEASESNLTTNCKNQAFSGIKLRSFMGRSEQVVKSDQGPSQETSKFSIIDEVRTGGYKDQMVSEAQLKGFDRVEIVGSKSPAASQMDIGIGTATVGDVTSDVNFSRRDDAGMRNPLVAQSFLKPSHNCFRSLSGQFEGGTGLRFNEPSSVNVGGDQFTSQPQWGSFVGEAEDYAKKESTFSSKQQITIEDSDVPRMKYQKPDPSSREQLSKPHSKNETRAAFENSNLNCTGKEVTHSQDSVDAATVTPLEHVHRVRPSKGNQGLNDNLKMKANELEKLFAEHKLQVPGNQSGSALRSESADAHVGLTANLQYRKPEALQPTPHTPARKTVLEQTGNSGNATNFDAKSIHVVKNYISGDASGLSFTGLNFSDNSKGRFYEKYMQKRDAKLREEWNSNGAEKEARMKALEDSLERSRAEMKAKFSTSTNRKDSLSGTQHSEKLRSFNLRSNVKREQHPIGSSQNEADEYLSEFLEEKVYGAPSQSRKNLLDRNTSSTIPGTTAISILHSSAKVFNNTSGRRRDSPLAQSVPNFSDLRKENTKPSSGVSKTTTRFQGRNHARSKSINKEMGGIKEEQSKRPQSLQQNSANPSKFKNMSPPNSDGVVLSPLKFDKEQTDLGSYDQSSWSFLRKGLDTSVRASTLRMKDSIASEAQNNEEFDELGFEEEDALDMAKEEEVETETLSIEDCTHNGRLRLSQESGKSGNSGSKIGNPTRTLAQGEPVSVAEMPSAIPSAFNSMRCQQDSPTESPVSWNSHLYHPFSYPNESSDVDASVDSPIGSPASWNSQPLTQPKTDAARMRKKWGNAQQPTLVSDASHNQPRKDVTKGFKRLLKFGRKGRGSESLADWISATTSEGDDDTEDGRDPANRSSEDSRKSRIGFSQGHPSDDSFNESELFKHVQSLQSSIPPPPDHFKLRDDHISGSSIRAPRSFFSLSSFRSKGSDIKLS